MTNIERYNELVRHMDDSVLIDQFEEFDTLRRTSPYQETVDHAIAVMNLIAEESDRREFNDQTA